MEYDLDLSSLFKAVGINKVGSVHITEHTHDFDPKKPKDHWLYAAFLGFQKYAEKVDKIDSFATIGTGAGIDAIGAYEILKPNKIFLTDVHPKIPQVAKRNVENNIGKNVEVVGLQGDLCQPLIEKGIKVDVVYANIPNIPSEQPRLEGMDSASFYKKRAEDSCPEKFNKYLLTLQFLFLKEAKKVLKKGGSVIDAIGGRLPYDILKDLFISNGYEFNELASVFKIQTEPDYVLGGYSKAEKRYGVEFDFYDYDEAQKRWLEIEHNRLDGLQLREELKDYRVSASEAYGNFKKDGKQFGHLIHILSGKL